MTSKWTLLLGAVVFVLSSAGCSDDKGATSCAAPAAADVRAPEGDSLCANTASCSTTGQPDHQGCPNTCSCLCHEGLCYQRACTQIGSCTDPPVYR
jgi:hypothetical protein